MAPMDYEDFAAWPQRVSGVPQQHNGFFAMQNIEEQDGIDQDAEARFHHVPLLALHPQARCAARVRVIISGSMSNV